MEKERIIQSYIELLEFERSSFIDLAKSFLESSLPMTDSTLFFFGYISRTTNVLDWVTYALKTENITVAWGLLRMLFETLSVVHYLAYHPSRDGQYFQNFLKHWKVVKIKPNWDVQEVKHWTMVEHLVKAYPELENIWKETSEFIHFWKRERNLLFLGIDENIAKIKVGGWNSSWYENGEMRNFILWAVRICKILREITKIQLQKIVEIRVTV
jgi:hypothetical protein